MTKDRIEDRNPVEIEDDCIDDVDRDSQSHRSVL